MAPAPATGLDNLQLDELTAVCLQLDLRALVRVAQTCKRFRYGDGGLETVELPTKSPVVTALREHAFPGGVGIPSMRPIGSSESWVAYLTRFARQRRCREAPPIAAGYKWSLFIDAAGRLLACGKGAAVGNGHDQMGTFCPDVTPVAAEAGLWVRSVAAGHEHSLALGWEGQVYSWGQGCFRQLGHGDTLDRRSPALVNGLERARSVAASGDHSLVVTQSGTLLSWGRGLTYAQHGSLRPVIVEGFGGVRVRRVSIGESTAFAIGEAGELSSWGMGGNWVLGHGDTESQPSPKRVEALRDIRVSSVAVGSSHTLALTENGLVYAWGENAERAVLGDPQVEMQLLPTPVEALRGLRVGSIAAAGLRSYAATDTGELWAWRINLAYGTSTPLGHGELYDCQCPKPIASLRGLRVVAVDAGENHTLAVADDGSVYAWGHVRTAKWGSLGLGPTASLAQTAVRTPQRIPALRVACCL
jgi:alpha-tubulin suppressor-like RCC1 family protein